MKKILLATMLAVIAGTLLVTPVTEAHAVQKVREAFPIIGPLVHLFQKWLHGQPSNSNVVVISMANSTSTHTASVNVSQLGTAAGDPLGDHNFQTLGALTLLSGESGKIVVEFVPTTCTGKCAQLSSPPTTITIAQDERWP